MTNISRTFHIQTFGCQMNASDSDWLARSLEARGFTEAPFETASFYILNTCSVRDKAEQKVYSELGRIARYCKVHGRQGVTVCVGGCVAQQVGAGLSKRFPQVRLVFGTDGVARAPEAISRLAEEPRLRLALLDFAGEYEEREDPRLSRFFDGAEKCSAANEAAQEQTEKVTRTAFSDEAAGQGHTESTADVPPTVFVNIMQGCNNFCTYCIVPYVRGRQKSRAEEAVLAECRALIDGGAREITLLGQNVNSYGLDGSPLEKGEGECLGLAAKNAVVALPTGAERARFAELLHKVARLPGLERLRFVTPHPKDIAPEVIDAFAELDVLCPRLHLPLQSGSDAILRAMNRRYDTARYMDIVQRLKKARPGIVLTTDIIVGFPGETEEDFEATMRIMQAVGFASSFSFVYSDRPGAKAVLLKDKIPRKVALERLSHLQSWQNQASDRILASVVGCETVILLDGKSRRESLLPEDDSASTAGAAEAAAREGAAGPCGSIEAWQGKTPEGFIVNVELSSPPPRQGGWLGAMLPVAVDAAARHSLKARQSGQPW